MKEVLLILFSVIGFLISCHVYNQVHRKKRKLVCLKGDNCNIVVTSKYGKTFGMDNSLLGMLYYTTILLIGIFPLASPQMLSANYFHLAELLVSGGAVFFTIYLTYIELFILNAICEYCTASGILSVLIFLTIVFL